MPKYLVSTHLTISVHTEVDADSPEEAKNIAGQRGVMGLCHSCASSDESDVEWRTSGELDSLPDIDDPSTEVIELDK